MATVLRQDRTWTADEFMVTDQHSFGDLWRYELVDGDIIGHAAPAPDHGAIIAGLIVGIGNRLGQLPRGCRPESGSGAAPLYAQRTTARIPDLMIRCGQHPRVSFEVVSPWELKDWRGRDRKRRDMQAVEGVEEIVEVYQDDYAIHLYRKRADGEWTFEVVDGKAASLPLASVGLELPLAEIYQFVHPPLATDDPAP